MTKFMAALVGLDEVLTKRSRERCLASLRRQAKMATPLGFIQSPYTYLLTDRLSHLWFDVRLGRLSLTKDSCPKVKKIFFPDTFGNLEGQLMEVW